MPERSAAKATNVSYICTSTVSHRLTHSQISCLGFALFQDYVRLGFVYSILNLISYQPVSSYWLRWVIGHLFVNSGNVQFKVVIIIWDIPPWLSTSKSTFLYLLLCVIKQICHVCNANIRKLLILSTTKP